MYKVLFVCVGNAARSQMAAAYFNHLSGSRAGAESAGTVPASRVDPAVIKLMQEDGIDISSAVPKLLTQDMLASTNRVVTMGCGAENACPAKCIATEDWGLVDPKGKPVEEVRQIRADIKRRVTQLLEVIRMEEKTK